MSFFDGVTLSLAGLVVLAFAVLRFHLGEILFGKRAWGKITVAAALVIGGVAFLKPGDLSQGMVTAFAVTTREAYERTEPLLAAIASKLRHHQLCRKACSHASRLPG